MDGFAAGWPPRWGGRVGIGNYFPHFPNAPLARRFNLPPVKTIRRVKRDADAFFSEQQSGNFLPRLAPLALLVDEIKVRFQDAVERFAAAFWLCRFGHRRTE